MPAIRAVLTSSRAASAQVDVASKVALVLQQVTVNLHQHQSIPWDKACPSSFLPEVPHQIFVWWEIPSKAEKPIVSYQYPDNKSLETIWSICIKCRFWMWPRCLSRLPLQCIRWRSTGRQGTLPEYEVENETPQKSSSRCVPDRRVGCLHHGNTPCSESLLWDSLQSLFAGFHEGNWEREGEPLLHAILLSQGRWRFVCASL